MLQTIRAFIWTCRNGKWSCGWERWEGKPSLCFDYTWYDGPHYTLHVGPLWVSVDA